MEAIGREALEQVLNALPERERQVERDALAALRRPENRTRLQDLNGAA